MFDLQFTIHIDIHFQVRHFQLGFWPLKIKDIENAGINLSPGTKTTLSIRNRFVFFFASSSKPKNSSQIIRTQFPYGGKNCTDEDLSDDASIYDGVYSFVKCQKACIQQEMISECSCVGQFIAFLLKFSS